MWAMASAELAATRDGSTTDKPLLSENQILPAESETTDRLRFTPSVLSRPSVWSYSRASSALTTPLSSLSRGTRKTCFEVAIQNLPPLSSAIPTICSRRTSGDSRGIRKRLEARKARPPDVPLQRIPDESSKRQLISGKGKPSKVV